MDIKYISPFLEGLKRILESFGVTDIKRGQVLKKETMQVDLDITSVVGIVGDIRGNIAYSLSSETAKKIVSSMMMGMSFNELDALARSAIGELANMVTGTATGILSNDGVTTDITPPSIIFGEDIFFIISSVQTIAVQIQTSAGMIEVNIGLEM